MAVAPKPDRIRTFDLNIFNMALSALQRASHLASEYDYADAPEHIEIQKALDAEMTLARKMMDNVRIKNETK